MDHSKLTAGVSQILNMVSGVFKARHGFGGEMVA